MTSDIRVGRGGVQDSTQNLDVEKDKIGRYRSKMTKKWDVFNGRSLSISWSTWYSDWAP